MSGKTPEPTPQLLGDIRQLIEQSRQQLASTVNSALTLLYWHIGQRIRCEVLQGQRAGYGEGIVSALARQLEAEYGRGFSEKNLRHMLRLAEAFPGAELLGRLPRSAALTWLAAADVVLSASRLEGAPSVIREARALGTPVVATPAGDLSGWAETDPDLWLVR